MVLTDVQEKMIPGAVAAMAKTLDYHEATQAFQLTLVDTAVREFGGYGVRGAVYKAAMKLGVNPSLISQMISGRSHIKRRARGEDPQPAQEKRS